MSSVFLWELDDGGFAGVVLLKKSALLSLPPFPSSSQCSTPDLTSTYITPINMDTPTHPTPSPDTIKISLRLMGLHPRLRNDRARAQRALQSHQHHHAPARLQRVTFLFIYLFYYEAGGGGEHRFEREYDAAGPFLSSYILPSLLPFSHLNQTKPNLSPFPSPSPSPPSPTQVVQDLPLTDFASHVPNMGRLVEDQEIKMRNLLQEVYFGKTKDVVYDLRSVESLEKARMQRDLQKELAGLLRK